MSCATECFYHKKHRYVIRCLNGTAMLVQSYFSNSNTVWDFAFAWASIDVAACVKI
jgi:hypothetical protein